LALFCERLKKLQMSFIVEQVFGFLNRAVFSSLRDERGTMLVFFYPHGSCVLSDLAYVQDICPTTGSWRQDSAAKIMRQPQLHNPRPSNDAERLGCHCGIFHHRGSGYLSRLGGSEGNSTLLRAKGTRHVGKKYATTPAVHAKAARRLRNHARLGKKILGVKTWLKRLSCWAETRVRVSARWRKLGGKNRE
jgi:hypothetical protein